MKLCFFEGLQPNYILCRHESLFLLRWDMEASSMLPSWPRNCVNNRFSFFFQHVNTSDFEKCWLGIELKTLFILIIKFSGLWRVLITLVLPLSKVTLVVWLCCGVVMCALKKHHCPSANISIGLLVLRITCCFVYGGIVRLSRNSILFHLESIFWILSIAALFYSSIFVNYLHSRPCTTLKDLNWLCCYSQRRFPCFQAMLWYTIPLISNDDLLKHARKLSAVVFPIFLRDWDCRNSFLPYFLSQLEPDSHCPCNR